MKNKRFMALMLVILMTCFLCGCTIRVTEQVHTADDRGENTVEYQCEGQLKRISKTDICTEYIDVETGVHYWYVFRSGFSPRYNADGTLMVGE